jgi:hypothetical protein
VKIARKSGKIQSAKIGQNQQKLAKIGKNRKIIRENK